MRNRCLPLIAAAVTVLSLNVGWAAEEDAVVPVVDESDRARPVDFGAGPGVAVKASALATQAAGNAQPAEEADGNPYINGTFGPAFAWPIIPIHAVLLPDGRVMSYGTNQNGAQTGQFNYDVWTPSGGADPTAHNVLPNTTGTDIFCSGQSVISSNIASIDGQVLMTGGDSHDPQTGERNFSNDATTIFNPLTNSIRSGQTMVYKRWYPSVITLFTGDKLVLGGREDKAPTPAIVPELFSKNGVWRVLTGAASDAAFGVERANWYYPRGYQLPLAPGNVFVLGNTGKMFSLSTTAAGGAGSIVQLPQQTSLSNFTLPTVQFAPGRLLSVRANRQVVTIGLNGAQPSITPTASISAVRQWANGTLMADGKVLVTGGSAVGNQLTGVAYAAETWDPATGTWTLGANATKPRLYHSMGLLLPDGTILTGGGGAPGPVKNLNVEIYYPPYLYTATGTAAPRPTLVAAPTLLTPKPATTFAVTVGVGDTISRVTLLRTGSVTHSNNPDQNFQQLAFTQAGQNLTITAPGNPYYTVPGYYMLFVFNDSGVPSFAKILRVAPAG